MFCGQCFKKFILFLIMFVLIGIPNPLNAQEDSTMITSVGTSKDVQLELNSLKTVAIFLNGANPLTTRIIEDALSIKLLQSGFVVISRETLEKTLGDQITKKKETKEEGSVNALQIGQLVNADAIITGTVIVEESEKLLLVRIASFQILEIKTEDLLLSVLFEGEKGRSFSETAKRFVDILNESGK